MKNIKNINRPKRTTHTISLFPSEEETTLQINPTDSLFYRNKINNVNQKDKNTPFHIK